MEWRAWSDLVPPIDSDNLQRYLLVSRIESMWRRIKRVVTAEENTTTFDPTTCRIPTIYLHGNIFDFRGKIRKWSDPRTHNWEPTQPNPKSSGRLLFDGTVFDPSQTIIDVICHYNHCSKETLSSLELGDLSKCQAKEDISSTWSRRLSIRSNL